MPTIPGLESGYTKHLLHSLKTPYYTAQLYEEEAVNLKS